MSEYRPIKQNRKKNHEFQITGEIPMKKTKINIPQKVYTKLQVKTFMKQTI